MSATPIKQDVEKVPQLRSRLESILNVAQRLRLRCFHRLRPCWTSFLSVLRKCLSVKSHMGNSETVHRRLSVSLTEMGVHVSMTSFKISNVSRGNQPRDVARFTTLIITKEASHE